MKSLHRHKPILYCFCGPTASGKSSICDAVVGRVPFLQLSISSTTRSPREGEVDGEDYYFISREEFERKIKQGKFIEHAEFSGSLYGTDKTNIDKAFAEGNDLVLEIEVQGAAQLKKLYPDNLITIFVFPPSFSEMKERLRRRGQDSEEQMAQRLKIAEREIEILTANGFSDYLLVNDDLKAASAKARQIVEAERMRYNRCRQEFIAKLLAR